MQHCKSTPTWIGRASQPPLWAPHHLTMIWKTRMRHSTPLSPNFSSVIRASCAQGFDDRLIQKLQSQLMMSTLTSNRGRVDESSVGGWGDWFMGKNGIGYGARIRENSSAAGYVADSLGTTLNWLGKKTGMWRRMKGGRTTTFSPCPRPTATS